MPDTIEPTILRLLRLNAARAERSLRQLLRGVFKPGFFVIYSQNFDNGPAGRAISGRQAVMAI